MLWPYRFLCDPSLIIYILLREILTDSNGLLLGEGDIARDEKLAVTMEKIAADPHDFYEGKLAQDIVDDVADFGMTMKE